MKTFTLSLLLVFVPVFFTDAQQPFEKIKPVSFSRVEITDYFWMPRIHSVAAVTLPVCIEQTEIKTPRIKNFENVALKSGARHQGIYYDDSDVYKALEAISYSLQNVRDSVLEKKADEWIDKIAAAQLDDGYLNTYYTLNGLSERWSDMEKHEDYCAGHLIEAGIAYHNATGKRKLLDVAIRFANHIDVTFRLANRPWVSGHQEIELALVKLYRSTGEKRYLHLAEWFLEQRGHGRGKGVIWDQWKQPEYCQDDVPVKEQTEIKGHAVRAMYLYTGAADVAANTNDAAYMASMKAIWEDVVYRNMYITGGIGSSGKNEGFSADYDLPNEHAYCETCASVGMVFWNQRMNLLTGDSRYVDVLERSLYNGALDGLSLKGDRFFYGNPLASYYNHERREWFGTACCPSNISRLVASVGDYIYASSTDAVWVNLFIGSKTLVPVKRGHLLLEIQGNYPWDGEIALKVNPSRPMEHNIKIRIPGWATGSPVPGETYRYLPVPSRNVSITVNGVPVSYQLDSGYAVIKRTWRKNDVVNISLPMEIKRVIASDSVAENRNRVAIERGPLVYCVESPDNMMNVHAMILTDSARLEAVYRPGLLRGVMTLEGEVPVVQVSSDGSRVSTTLEKMTAIPYFSWANRGKSAMQVWLPRKAVGVLIRTQ